MKSARRWVSLSPGEATPKVLPKGCAVLGGAARIAVPVCREGPAEAGSFLRRNRKLFISGLKAGMVFRNDTP